ncbi:Protein of unknown function [Gryllus bimaculatus]|nr:Protein of unknown function [Gryllus bimaculatus]
MCNLITVFFSLKEIHIEFKEHFVFREITTRTKNRRTPMGKFPNSMYLIGSAADVNKMIIIKTVNISFVHTILGSSICFTFCFKFIVVDNIIIVLSDFTSVLQLIAFMLSCDFVTILNSIPWGRVGGDNLHQVPVKFCSNVLFLISLIMMEFPSGKSNLIFGAKNKVPEVETAPVDIYVTTAELQKDIHRN